MSRYAFPVLAFLICLGGCGGAAPKAETTPESQPATPAAEATAETEAATPAEPAEVAGPYQPTETQRPASVLAVAVAPNPLAFAQNVAAYSQNAKLPLPFSPDNIGDMMTAALESNGASGLRIDAPAYVVVADADNADMPIAIMLPASDVEAVAAAIRAGAPTGNLEVLTANGYVVAAEAPVLELVADYAFTGLRAEPVPAHPTVTAFGPSLRAKYVGELGMARAFITGMKASDDRDEAMAAGIVEMYLELAMQIETMSFSLEATADLASLVYSMTGTAGTTLAAFAEAQKPAEFSELAYLPEQDKVFVAAGRMDWRPIAGAMTAFSQTMLALDPTEDKTGEPTDWAAIFEMLDDEFAMAVSWNKAMTLAGSYRTNASEKARDKMAAWWKELSSSPMFDAKKTRMRKRRVRGKAVTEFQYALADMPEDAELAEAMDSIMGKPPYRSAVVALPGRLGFASLAGARKQIAGLIARSNKPGAADLPSWAALAKDRSESFAHVFDGSAIARTFIQEMEPPDEAAETLKKIPAGILIPQGMGFSGRTLSFRTSVPAAVAELIGKFAMGLAQQQTPGGIMGPPMGPTSK